MSGLTRIRAVLVPAAAGVSLVVGASAAAVPPTGISVKQQDIALPVLSWNVPPGAREILLEIRRGPRLVVDEAFAAPRSSWRAERRLDAGRYQARVGARFCTEDEDEPCPAGDFSPPVTFVVPKPSIEPGRGIAYVRRGMTQAQVQAIWGRPYKSYGGDDTLRGVKYWAYWYVRPKGFTVTFRGRPLRVEAVGTNDRNHRVKGVGVGSTERQVRAAFPALRCKTYSVVQRGQTLSWRECTLGRLARGRVVTAFAMNPRARNRVGGVSVFRIVKMTPTGPL